MRLLRLLCIQPVLALSLLVACSGNGKTIAATRPPPERVTLTLDKAMVMEAFTEFCKTITDEVCDAPGRYVIDVYVQRDDVTLVFVHEDINSAQPNAAIGFGCSFQEGEPDCFSGRLTH